MKQANAKQKQNTKSNYMKRINYVTFLLAASIFMFSCEKRANDSKDIAEESNEAKFDETNLEQDAEFAVTAADGGLLEVQLGLLAQHNSLSPEVKKLGKMMVDDHTKANEELRNLASKRGISLPDRMSEKNQEKYDDFVKKTGNDFDKAYTEFMVKDHKEDIDKFKKEFDKGEYQELRTWASEKVPTLEHHLDMAEQTERIVKDENKRTSRD
jgi:putative membrane protein